MSHGVLEPLIYFHRQEQ